jgi:hypothetical protein
MEIRSCHECAVGAKTDPAQESVGKSVDCLAHNAQGVRSSRRRERPSTCPPAPRRSFSAARGVCDKILPIETSRCEPLDRSADSLVRDFQRRDSGRHPSPRYAMPFISRSAGAAPALPGIPPSDSSIHCEAELAGLLHGLGKSVKGGAGDSPAAVGDPPNGIPSPHRMGRRWQSRMRCLNSVGREQGEVSNPSFITGQPILDVLGELTSPERPYGCSAVFCTATQPALGQDSENPDEFPRGLKNTRPIIPPATATKHFGDLDQTTRDLLIGGL